MSRSVIYTLAILVPLLPQHMQDIPPKQEEAEISCLRSVSPEISPLPASDREREREREKREMGVIGYVLDMVSDMVSTVRSRRKFSKHKQLRTVEIRVRMDCEGCERRVHDAVRGMKDVTDVVVEPKQSKVTVTGYVEPRKVLRRVSWKTGKKAEIWPFVPYALVDRPYAPGVYDRKAPAGYVRNNAGDLARAGSAEERLVSAFSDDNPNACAVM